MALKARQSISIILPAYNEEGNIAQAVEQAIHCLDPLFEDWEMILVNDGSKDSTGQIMHRLVQENFRFSMINHPRNLGYGAALQSGIRRARKNLVFFCDSDLQFHLTELLLLLAWIEQYDLVIGYRIKRHDAFFRKLNAWGWNLLVRNLLDLRVQDIDCAFKLFRRDVFQAIKIDAVGAMVNTDILVQATRMGFTLKELPITHFPRTNGQATGADLSVILKAFKELFALYAKLQHLELVIKGFDRRRHTNGFQGAERRNGGRRKVLLPINFPDRRKRVLTPSGRKILSPRAPSLSSLNLVHGYGVASSVYPPILPDKLLNG